MDSNAPKARFGETGKQCKSSHIIAIAVGVTPALALIIHEASTAAADPGMSAALRSVGLLGVLSSTLVGPLSRALHPCLSASPRYESS